MNAASHAAIALAAAFALGGCATLPPGTAKDHAPAANGAPSPQAIANAQRLAGAPGSTPPQAVSPLSSLRTFAEATRDAKELPGLFNLWQRDDKVYIEIAPDQLDKMYFFSTNLDQGLGESRFLAGSMTSSLSRKFGGGRRVVLPRGGPVPAR